MQKNLNLFVYMQLLCKKVFVTCFDYVISELLKKTFLLLTETTGEIL